MHGLVYAVFMSMGVFLRPGPAGRLASSRLESGEDRRATLVTTANVSARNAIRTPQFWCLWVVLCINVTAGIGILEKAAPMISDFFANTSTPVAAAAAAGFVWLGPQHAPRRSRDDAVRSFGFVAAGDWRAVIDDPAVDVVFIAAPNMLHLELIEAAAAAGKHVFCEKPVGGTPEQTVRAEQAARHAA